MVHEVNPMIVLNWMARPWCLPMLGAALLSACACAQPQGGHPAGPPPEALAACKGQSAGKDCSFTTPRGNEVGTCWAPEGKPLACKPKNAAQPTSPAKP